MSPGLAARFAVTSLVAALLAGCAAEPPALSPMPVASQPVAPVTVRTIDVAPFQKEQYYSPHSAFGLGPLSDRVRLNERQFSTMLAQALARSKVFPAADGEELIDIVVSQTAWRDLSTGSMSMTTVETELNYTIRLADGRELYTTAIKGRGGADAYFGSIRAEQANRRTYTDNINAFLADLQCELPQRWAALRDRKPGKEVAARPVATAPTTEQGEAVANGAVVRPQPKTDAPAPATPPPADARAELAEGGRMAAGFEKGDEASPRADRRTRRTAALNPKNVAKPGPEWGPPPSQTPPPGATAAPSRTTSDTGYIASPEPVDYVVVADATSRSAPRETAAPVRTFRKGDQVSVVVTSRNGYLLTRSDGVFAGWLPQNHATPATR